MAQKVLSGDGLSTADAFLLQPPLELPDTCLSFHHPRTPVISSGGSRSPGLGPAKRQMGARPGPNTSHPDPPPATHSGALSWAPNSQLDATPLHVLTLLSRLPSGSFPG